MKAEDNDLYESLRNHINPITGQLSNNIEEIPMGKIDKLEDKGYLALPQQIKNTIKALVEEDHERLKPKQLKMVELPQNFRNYDNNGIPTGPTVKDVNKLLEKENIDIKNIKNLGILERIDSKDISSNGKVNLNKLAPKDLRDLEQNKLITLDNDAKNLINGIISAEADIFNPLKNIDINEGKAVSGLSSKFKKSLPSDFDLDKVINELGNIQLLLPLVEKVDPELHSELMNNNNADLGNGTIKAEYLTPEQILKCDKDDLIKLPSLLKQRVKILNDVIKTQEKPLLKFNDTREHINNLLNEAYAKLEKEGKKTLKGNFGIVNDHI